MIPDWEHDTVVLAEPLQIRHPRVCERLLQILNAHAIDVRFVSEVKDIWCRDYLPVQVGHGRFVQFRYEPDYLADVPELRTRPKSIRLPTDFDSPTSSDINLDGGNLVTCGRNAVCTDKIYRENPEWERSTLRRELCRLLELDELIVIPKEPYDPIGHSDGMVRFIHGQAVVVNKYPPSDATFERRLVGTLTRHGLAVVSVPYLPQKGSALGVPSAVGCYSNFLLTCRVLIVPMFGLSADKEALSVLQHAFSSVPALGLDCTDLAAEGGVLNCICGSFRR